MNNPIPADVSRLKNILGGAKALMNKVESGNYEKGNVNLDTSVSGDQLIEHTNGSYQQNSTNTNSVAPKIVNGQPQYKNMESSKMPSFIKEAMLNNPIPQLNNPNHTFSLEDVSDLIDKPLPTKVSNNKQSIRENIDTFKHTNDTFTVSETALRGIITDIVKDQLLHFMSETFAKQLNEQAIKKTINILLKEGKISPKRKIGA